jgi:hypothetical protein
MRLRIPSASGSIRSHWFNSCQAVGSPLPCSARNGKHFPDLRPTPARFRLWSRWRCRWCRIHGLGLWRGLRGRLRLRGRDRTPHCAEEERRLASLECDWKFPQAARRKQKLERRGISLGAAEKAERRTAVRRLPDHAALQHDDAGFARGRPGHESPRRIHPHARVAREQGNCRGAVALRARDRDDPARTYIDRHRAIRESVARDALRLLASKGGRSEEIDRDREQGAHKRSGYSVTAFRLEARAEPA